MDKTVFNIYSVLLILFGIELYFSQDESFDRGLFICALVQIVLFFVVGIRNQPKLFTSWISPFLILLLGMVIVNYQTLLNLMLGIGSFSEYTYEAYGMDYLKHSYLCISICSMSSFLLSCLNVSYKQFDGYDFSFYDTRILDYLLLASFFYFIATINIAEFLTGSVYSTTGANTGVSDYGYSERLLDSLIFICLAVYSHNIKLNSKSTGFFSWFKEFPVKFWIIVIAYLLLRLLSGDRGPVIYIIFALLYSCMYCFHLRIRIVPLLITGVFGVMFMAVMSYARVQSSHLSFEEKMIEGQKTMGALKSESISPFTQELANSVTCSLVMLNDIEKSKTDYKYGGNMITTLLISFPGMGIIKNKVFQGEILTILPSGEYITISSKGKDYKSGMGSTVIADFFYDFGVVGCILGCFLIGYVYKWFSYVFLSDVSISVVLMIIILKMSSLSIYVPRSSLWATIGSSIFVLVIYFIVSPLIKKSSI